MLNYYSQSFSESKDLGLLRKHESMKIGKWKIEWAIQHGNIQKRQNRSSQGQSEKKHPKVGKVPFFVQFKYWQSKGPGFTLGKSVAIFRKQITL